MGLRHLSHSLKSFLGDSNLQGGLRAPGFYRGWGGEDPAKETKKWSGKWGRCMEVKGRQHSKEKGMVVVSDVVSGST